MATAYDSRTPTLDRMNTAEFSHTPGQQTGQEMTLQGSPEVTRNFSNHPGLQIADAHREASDLAMPADAHRGEASAIPESQEVAAYRLRVEAGEPTIFTERTPGSNEDYLNAVTGPDYTAPNPETANYRAGDELIEAYNAACAIMAVRKASLGNSQEYALAA
jgi:hypothetical protein